MYKLLSLYLIFRRYYFANIALVFGLIYLENLAFVSELEENCLCDPKLDCHLPQTKST